ncbi:MAG: DUF1353 domain-containing protein [Pseudomonadota bacterium]
MVNGNLVTLLLTLLVILTSSGLANEPDERVLDYEFVEKISKSACPYCRAAVPYITVRIFKDRKRDGIPVGVLVEDFWYCDPGSGHVFRVPAGFETDFLSIPEVARAAIRPRDYIEAAVIHDWMYAVGERGRRKFADEVFLQALKKYDAPAATRLVLYSAVRNGGAPWYKYPPAWRFVDPKSMRLVTPIARPSKPHISVIENCKPFPLRLLMRKYNAKVSYR